MRKIENSDDWYAGYLRDTQIAQEEIALTIRSESKKIYCDVYSLPSHNHQTFYCRVINENGFSKVEYAKPIQNSIWFSDPIYMYRFEEAKRFSDHPIRKGRILCGKKIIRNSLVENLLSYLNALSDEQPDDLVNPTIEANLTVIRLYEDNKIIREILYTDSEKLSFKDGEKRDKLIEVFRDLHLYIEKIIGVGLR